MASLSSSVCSWLKARAYRSEAPLVQMSLNFDACNLLINGIAFVRGRPFQPSLMFVGTYGLGWKGLTGINAFAYYKHS